MKRFAFALTCATIALWSAGPARAQANDPSAPLTVYVGAFEPAEVPADSGRGPVHALTSAAHTHRVDRNAERLSAAIVRALASHNVQAQALPAGAPPRSGWIVRGFFYSLDSGQHLIAVPFLAGKKDQPNVEVSVAIADAGKDPTVPFAVIGTDAALKGQGGPIAWNPYVIAARFAIQNVEADKSIDALAEEIAAQILADRETLEQHDTVPAVLSPDSDASRPTTPADASR